MKKIILTLIDGVIINSVVNAERKAIINEGRTVKWATEAISCLMFCWRKS